MVAHTVHASITRWDVLVGMGHVFSSSRSERVWPAAHSPMSESGVTCIEMTTLTKDQVGKLPPEQQEALAAAAMGRIRSRQELSKRARRGVSGWAGVWAGLTLAIASSSIVLPRALPFAIIAVAGLVGYHVSRLYRRLDAMMELFDQETKIVTEREQSDDDSASS